jgi:membrane-associated phospholipid phosphatase
MKHLRTTILLTFFVSAFCTTRAQSVDYTWLKSINGSPNAGLDNYAIATSASVNYMIVAAPVGLFVGSLFEGQKDMRQKSYEVAGAIFLTVGETYLLKLAIARDRPYITYPDIRNLATESNLSFPSGHTSAAFAVATSLSLNYPKWYVTVPSFLWASSVGYSRMREGVHYPTDVLGGMVLGIGTAWLSHEGMKWLNKRKKVNN